jgi:hypothetical protein
MKVIKILSLVILIALLTLITQVGGVLFLISIAIFQLFKRKIRHWFTKSLVFVLLFCSIYITAIFTLVPFIAERFGRVPLPLTETNYVKPATRLTYLLCRNYVRPELRVITYKVAKQMNKSFPGSKINYLEANFPFINRFPLLPHLSHNDGKKLDLAFYYLDKESGLEIDKVPSFIGYGICEEPKDGEEDMPFYCEQKGFWQYSFLTKIISQSNKDKFIFDVKRTKAIANLFCENSLIGMAFIEPHLKTRLGLTNPKVRFHGCQAVRHDDHLHVQLR